MVKLIKIIGTITMWSLLLTTCLYATRILDLKNEKEYIYEYTDLNGNKGTSKHCFNKDSINLCKIGKYTRKVIEIEKKEVE